MPPELLAQHLSLTRAAVLNHKASVFTPGAANSTKPFLDDFREGWYYQCSLAEPMRATHGKRVIAKPRAL